MKKFSYEFLKDEYLPAKLFLYAGNIEASEGSGRMIKECYPKAFTEMEKISRVQSIKSSNEIEGIVTTNDRINSIIEGNTAPKSHSEQEITGYRDALDQIHRNHDEIKFNEDTFKKIHAIIMQQSRSSDAGEYKTENNIISEECSDGTRAVRFRPISAEDTEEAIEQFVLAYQESYCDTNISKLLLIPCVILDFLCIHPFADGNGRISRLLTLLLLYKNGYDVCKYISMEERINNSKAEYYEALRKSSEKWHENKNDYIPFMEYFLKILSECYSELGSRFSIIHGKRANKSERIELVIQQSLSPLSKREICDVLPDVSPTTVEATLGKLIREGKIQKVGQGRLTKYVFVER